MVPALAYGFLAFFKHYMTSYDPEAFIIDDIIDFLHCLARHAASDAQENHDKEVKDLSIDLLPGYSKRCFLSSKQYRGWRKDAHRLEAKKLLQRVMKNPLGENAGGLLTQGGM